MSASNVLMGTAAGAGAGASIGGPWGAVAGGAVGLAASLFGEYESAENEKEKQRILEKAAAQLNTTTSQLQNKLDEYYANNSSIGTSADVDTYKSLISGYNPDEFVYDYDENQFNNDYDVNDYYAANKDAIIQKVSDQTQHTAAGAGIGRGTGAANQIATNVAEKNEDLYKDALAAMQSDRQFAYNLWNTNTQNAVNRLNTLNQNYQTQLGLYGNLANDYQTWNTNKLNQEMQLAQNSATNALNITLAGI